MNERTVRLKASQVGELYDVTLAFVVNGCARLEHILVRGVSKDAAKRAAEEYVRQWLNPESVEASIEQIGSPKAVYLEAS